MDSEEARRRARASRDTRVFRNDPDGEADAYARFWARMSPEERVRLACALSEEMDVLANPEFSSVESEFRDLLCVAHPADRPRAVRDDGPRLGPACSEQARVIRAAHGDAEL